MEQKKIKIGNILYCQQIGFVEIIKEPYFIQNIGWEADIKDEKGNKYPIPICALSKRLIIPKEYKKLVEFI